MIVKVNAADLIRRELAAPRWRGDAIAIGTNVDVYQRAEGRYRLMPRILTALRDFANPFSILTKGTLLLRDLDLLRQAASVTDVSLSMSIGFVDERMWRAVEQGAPSPRRRLDVVRRLTDAGFPVSVLMAPILPGLTDSDESIEETVAAVAAAGAVSVTPLPLHLRTGAREWYAAWLTRDHPELAARYRELYRDGSYLPQKLQQEIGARVRMAARRHRLHPAADGEARTARVNGPTAAGHPDTPRDRRHAGTHHRPKLRAQAADPPLAPASRARPNLRGAARLDPRGTAWADPPRVQRERPARPCEGGPPRPGVGGPARVQRERACPAQRGRTSPARRGRTRAGAA
nr:hypothetical protein GCM10020092_009720 [Actinoplanes digitatis]